MDKTICELFAGVGGFRLGFERLDSGWKTVWFSQWEPFAKNQWAHDCYIKHFGNSTDINGEHTTNVDISSVDKHSIPDHLVLVGGFPCQDYSVAQTLSNSKGIEGKKGVLWWQIKEIIEVKRPAFCIFENVDRLLKSPANQRGRDFGIILSCFHELGYSVEWRVINAATYGEAQRRRRVFIFAYRNDSSYGKTMCNLNPLDIIETGFMATAFPIEEILSFNQICLSNDILDVSNSFSFEFDNAGFFSNGIIYTSKILEKSETPIKLIDILESNVSEEYYIDEDKYSKWKYLKGHKKISRVSKTGYEYVFSEGSIPFPDILDKPGRTMLTSEASMNRSSHVIEDPETKRHRVLTPIEAERLQGFDDDWTNTGMPDRARYFCMGNALVVPIITRMGKVLDVIVEQEKKQFLYGYQLDAVSHMKNGCILNGGVGSGKSRTGLYYYFKENGGSIDKEYKDMKNPQDLYIITTAMKRNLCEWDKELSYFLLCQDPALNYYKNKVVVDSWNNIQKYKDIKNAFFIFDEDRVTGSGAWVKSFLKIAANNNWIILSATPGDTWEQYIPVFLANGFYKNKTEFVREHIIYSRFTKYPKIDRYINTGRLIRLRNAILIDMDFSKKTIRHDEDVYVSYDSMLSKNTIRNRWDPYKNAPIKTASGLCYILRRIVNSDEARQTMLLELLENKKRAIIFYNFDYELDILLNLAYRDGTKIAQWNGHEHQPIPDSDKWVYLVQYSAGCEGWNCILTDTIIFYSQNYSYKIVEQATGRIDRINTPYRDLYYYHLKSRSGIDLAISNALKNKKQFNERKFSKWD